MSGVQKYFDGTSCRQGHALTNETLTTRHRNGKDVRVCLLCERERDRARRKRNHIPASVLRELVKRYKDETA